MEPSGSNNNPTPPTGRYQCSLCPSCFKRPEHLKRHQQGHDGVRRFTCSICSKSFARSDILARHETTHRFAEQVHDGNLRSRACLECAKARERCSKGEPCVRCSTRRLQCTYPEGSTIRRPPGSQSTGPSSYDPQQDGEQSTPGAYQQYGSSQSMVALPEGHPGSSSPQGFSGAAGSNTILPSVPSQMVDGGDQQQHSRPALQVQYTQHAMQSEGSCPPPSHPSMVFASGVPPPQDPSTMRSPLSYSVPFEPHMPVDVYASVSQQAPYSQVGYDQSFDFPLNWLPANDNIDINYSSLLPYGVTSSPVDANQNMQPLVDQQMSGARSGMSSMSASRVMRNEVECSPSAQAASPAATSSTTSRPGTDGSTPGDLYATSIDGARIPCTARQRRPSIAIYGARPVSTVADGGAEPIPDSQCFAFPNLSHISFRGTDDAMPESNKRRIAPSAYNAIHNSFQKLCVQPGALYPAYRSGQFPSLEQLNLFVHLYFEYFAPTVPIIHEGSTDLGECWPLALAVAAIGCHYTQTKEFGDCIAPMHEFLRRVIAVDVEVENRMLVLSIPMAQSLILSQIGMVYAGSSRLFRQAAFRHGLLVSIVHAHDLLSAPHISLEGGTFGEEQWVWAMHEETKRRMGYAIFILDTMGSYHFGHKPLLSLQNCQNPLPDDGLWKAGDLQQACRAIRDSEGNQSLAATVQNLFVEKHLRPSLGEFGRVILLHGIYQEIFQIRQYYQRSLSAWVPCAQPAQNGNASLTPNIQPDVRSKKRLVEIPAFSSWRNASLDCVDVLHWAANAAIAHMSGAEPPIVHHLHMARVVLLTPYKDIRTLAQSVASFSPKFQQVEKSPSREDGLAAEREVAHWAQHDEHKARLAMIHCGCLFWHVRRYSTLAFWEPVSVFLATLALWAYSSYTWRSTPATVGRRNGSGSDDENEGGRSGITSGEHSPDRPSARLGSGEVSPAPPGPPSGSSAEILPRVPILPSPVTPGNDAGLRLPTFIRLDRPNDDEMVQLFVRSGRPDKMRAHITGVGDVCSPKGPARILKEGRRILQSVSMSWGRTKEYVSVLKAVEDMVSGAGVDSPASTRQNQ